jgi:hypothetical protein
VGGGSGKVIQPLLSATNRGRVNNGSAFFVAALTMNIIDHLRDCRHEKPMGDADDSPLGSMADTQSLKLIFAVGTGFADCRPRHFHHNGFEAVCSDGATATLALAGALILPRAESSPEVRVAQQGNASRVAPTSDGIEAAATSLTPGISCSRESTVW